jgi:hypothetical protein
MGLLLLEALGALVLLVLIVWWTMFSGRPGGELPPSHPAADPRPSPELVREERSDADAPP